MADRDDLKFTERPPRTLKPAAPAATGEDPLMELVRIMSGESIVDPTLATDGETVPVIGAVGSNVAPANDLETRLLTGLEALSSSFYLHPPPVPSAPPAMLATPSPKPAAAPHPKPQPAESAAPTPATPPVAAAPVAHAEKPALRPERPAIAALPRSEKQAQTVSPPRYGRQAPVADSANQPPFGRSTGIASAEAEKEKPELVLLPATTAVHLGPTETAHLKPSGHRETGLVKSPADTAPDPSRLAPPPEGTDLHQPKAAEPQEEESLKMAPSGGSSPVDERAVPPGNLDAQAAEDGGELPPLADEVEVSKFRPRRDLFVGGALLAVVLATGVTYVIVQSEKSVAMPPIIAADPAKIVPAVTQADNDQQKKLIHDYVDAAQSADRTKPVTPRAEKVAEVPASSGDHNPIPQVTEPAGPDFDRPAKADDTVSADPQVTDLARGGGESGQISPKGTRALAVGPELSLVGSKATSDDGAGKLSPGASPAVPPSATPAADGAADASSDALSGEKQMDPVINGKGSPIPINADPLALHGGAKAAADGATPARRRSPEPASVSVSDTSNAAAASDNGAAAADDGSAVPAAPARVPIPRARPIVLPHKADKVLPDNPVVADRRRDAGSALGNPYLKN